MRERELLQWIRVHRKKMSSTLSSKRKLKNPKLVKFCHLLNIYCSEYAFQDGMIRKNIYMWIGNLERPLKNTPSPSERHPMYKKKYFEDFNTIKENETQKTGLQYYVPENHILIDRCFERNIIVIAVIWNTCNHIVPIYWHALMWIVLGKCVVTDLAAC